MAKCALRAAVSVIGRRSHFHEAVCMIPAPHSAMRRRPVVFGHRHVVTALTSCRLDSEIARVNPAAIHVPRLRPSIPVPAMPCQSWAAMRDLRAVACSLIRGMHSMFREVRVTGCGVRA